MHKITIDGMELEIADGLSVTIDNGKIVITAKQAAAVHHHYHAQPFYSIPSVWLPDTLPNTCQITYTTDAPPAA